MNLRPGEWRDKTGKVWKISQMPTPYIRNAINVLRRRQTELIDAIGKDAEQAEEYLEMSAKLNELINEYFSRQDKFFDNPNMPVKPKEPTFDELMNELINKDIVETSAFLVWRRKFKRKDTNGEKR